MLDKPNPRSCLKLQTLSRYLDTTILVKIKASVARMCKQLVVAIEVVDAVEDGFPVGDELADRARVGSTLSRPYRRRAQKRLSGLEERAQILLSPSVENQ